MSASEHDEHTTAPAAGAGGARIQRRAMRAIAVFEAAKGLTAVAAGLGLLSLLHHDLHALAVALIGHFGLKPGDQYTALIVHYADVVADANRRSLMVLIVGYAALRLAEATGLWLERVWGQWLGALSGAFYLPFELRHLAHAPGIAGTAVVVGNLLIVGYLAWALWRERAARPASPAPPVAD